MALESLPSLPIKVIAVVGPTGSGKTALAVELAKIYDGVILSADSRQVYKGLDIGTNKEGTPGEYFGHTARYLNEIPQLLIDLVTPPQRYTLADWLKAARAAVRLIHSHQQLPVIVGGTGLYVSALANNWQLPADNPTLRATLEQLSLPELQKKAAKLQLSPDELQNRQRLIRILERLTSNQIIEDSLPLDMTILELDQERQQLYHKSDERYQRIWPSLLKETTTLHHKGVSWLWMEKIGLDYRFAAYYLQNKLSEKDAITQFQFASHAFIRRQQTWWRHHGPTIKVGSHEEAFQQIDGRVY